MATYLSKTFSSAGNQKTWTWSGWVKYTGGGSDFTMFSGGTGLGASGNRLVFQFLGGENEKVMASSGNTSQFAFKTSAMLRDKNAWYHFVLAMDTTQSTNSDRFKMYINGSQVTSTSQLTYPAQDLQLGINSNQQQYIGLRTSSDDAAFSGYMADVHFIDGTAKVATDFGQTDSTTGIWKPKTYSGSYGSNGYKLTFANAGALGTDTSGNSNNWTVNNAGTGAAVTDTPSNVFSILNSITADGGTFTLGSLKYVTNGTDRVCGISSFALTGSSKWYCEMKAITKTGNYFNFGVASSSKDMNDNGITYRSDGKIYKDGSENQSSLATFTDNDIIGVIYDCSNNQCSFQKNGSAVGSAVTIGDATRDIFFITGGNGGTNSTAEINFGNPPFSISSTNADSAGLGSFEYAVPSGAYSLCTNNINAYG